MALWCIDTVGLLVVLGCLVYLAIHKPFYILLLTVATFFFPANFEEALGQSFPVTPTRMIGLILLLPVALNHIKRGPRYLSENITMVLAIVTILWGAFTDLVSYPEYVGKYFIETIPALITLSAIVLFVRTKDKFNKLLVVIILACLVTAISGLFVFRQGRAAGLTGNANLLAYNCFVGLFILLSFYKANSSYLKKFYNFIIGLTFLVSFSSAASRGATIGLLVAVFVVLWKFIKKPTHLLLAVILCVLFFYVAPDIFWQRMSYIPMPGHDIYNTIQSETGVRMWMYKRGWELFLEKPIYGWGAFSFPTVSGSRIPWVMHSWYLAMLCETGIIGFILYIAFFISIYMNIKKAIKNKIWDTSFSYYYLALCLGIAAAGIFGSGPLRKLIFVLAGISIVMNNIINDEMKRQKLI